MCTNYRPGARDLIRETFGTPVDFDYPAEAFPGYMAPIVRQGADNSRECIPGRFGLVPHWAKDAKIGRSTYNARSETVAEKPSYRNAWRRRQFCLVPMSWFYEPCYESGRAEKTRIGRLDGSLFAVAGIWDRWVDPGTGEVVHSFSMLTVNADGHPVMGRMHRPGDEKRSIVPVEIERYDAWLGGEAAGILRMPGEAEWEAGAEAGPSMVLR